MLDKDGSLYFEDVGLSLAVDACERCVDGPGDAPHVFDQLGITGKNRFIIQLKEVFTLRERNRKCLVQLQGCVKLPALKRYSQQIHVCDSAENKLNF